jgi:hypothetical protein
VSPEKEDEKPIYESTEGPIPKVGRTAVGRPKAAMINSGESFGMNNMMKSGGVLGRGSSHAYLRETIKDDFLNEFDEDESSVASIRASAESGELYNPTNGLSKNLAKKK